MNPVPSCEVIRVRRHWGVLLCGFGCIFQKSNEHAEPKKNFPPRKRSMAQLFLGAPPWFQITRDPGMLKTSANCSHHGRGLLGSNTWVVSWVYAWKSYERTVFCDECPFLWVDFKYHPFKVLKMMVMDLLLWCFKGRIANPEGMTMPSSTEDDPETLDCGGVTSSMVFVLHHLIVDRCGNCGICCFTTSPQKNVVFILLQSSP